MSNDLKALLLSSLVSSFIFFFLALGLKLGQLGIILCPILFFFFFHSFKKNLNKKENPQELTRANAALSSAKNNYN